MKRTRRRRKVDDAAPVPSATSKNVLKKAAAGTLAAALGVGLGRAYYTSRKKTQDSARSDKTATSSSSGESVYTSSSSVDDVASDTGSTSSGSTSSVPSSRSTSSSSDTESVPSGPVSPLRLGNLQDRNLQGEQVFDLLEAMVHATRRRRMNYDGHMLLQDYVERVQDFRDRNKKIRERQESYRRDSQRRLQEKLSARRQRPRKNMEAEKNRWGTAFPPGRSAAS